MTLEDLSIGWDWEFSVEEGRGRGGVAVEKESKAVDPKELHPQQTPEENKLDRLVPTTASAEDRIKQ